MIESNYVRKLVPSVDKAGVPLFAEGTVVFGYLILKMARFKAAGLIVYITN